MKKAVAQAAIRDATPADTSKDLTLRTINYLLFEDIADSELVAELNEAMHKTQKVISESLSAHCKPQTVNYSS